MSYLDPGEQQRARSVKRHPVRQPILVPDLFEQRVLDTPTSEIAGMVRGADPMESQHASGRVHPQLTKIQERIADILARDGPHNAAELESRVEFSNCAPSTCRKRITELKVAGRIVQVGRRDGMAVWAIAPGATRRWP